MRHRTFSWLGRRSSFLAAHTAAIFFFARSQDAGNTFTPALNLSNSIAGDGKGRINRDVWHNGSLDLIAAPGGALYAAWTEYDGALWFIRSADGGKSFARPVHLAGTAARPARAPALAVGPGATLYLAWTLGEDDGADIHLAKSLDRGASFDAPRVVAPSKTYSDAPKLAVDTSGLLHLVYAESSGGPFARFHVRYTRSADAGRTFDPPRDISSPPPDGYAGAAYPALGIDASGRMLAIWELYEDVRRPPRGLGFAVSVDGGGSFSAPARVPGSVDPAGGVNGSGQGLLMRKLAVNATGSVAIVNSSFKTDARSRVWLRRGSLR